MGNRKFEKLRDVLVLPSKRTLQIMKSKIPNGSGYQRHLYEKLRLLWSKVANDPEDWDCIVSWDATGYKKTLKFNKHTGGLIGFGDHPESFSMHQMFSNKVNCFMVSSPQQDIEINFPVAYYHCSTLDSSVVRQQLFEVMHGLEWAGLNVVSWVCDGASEHAKMFKSTLKQFDDLHTDLKVRRDNIWAISDSPHLGKKFRSNWKSSGQKEWDTKMLRFRGSYIVWDIIRATHKVATTSEDGTCRFPRCLHKLTWDVVDPSSIQLLRVNLALIPFSKEVQEFTERNIHRISREAGVRIQDVRLTLTYMRLVNELFQIMNSREPISWTEEDDGTGTPIGLRDKLDTTHNLTLSAYSDKYGVSIKTLKTVTGLPHSHSAPEPNSVIFIDRLKILEDICQYFRVWKESITNLNQFSKAEKQCMFISHWLYDDLRRTCLGMVGVVRQNIPKTKRRWVPRRFSQDPIESLYSQIRGLSGSNNSMNTIDVDMGISEIRALIFSKFHVHE